ncbi:DUF397 domain-containing protein [Streptomyces sp. NPDC050418]|uniref:DUF397 domain-containing protein n=1 Tax=Streptomyces sp. NPDC050418 TaxID=3365612 RepID=UPI0037BCF53C
MREHVTIPDASVLPGWRKSSYSGGESGQCLEVNDTHPGTHIPVRDSKTPTAPAIPFTPTAWRTFITALHQGDLT